MTTGMLRWSYLLRSAWLLSCVLYLKPRKGEAGCGCSLPVASHPLYQVNVACENFSESSRGRVTLSILENPGHKGVGMGRGELPEKLLPGQVD